MESNLRSCHRLARINFLAHLHKTIIVRLRSKHGTGMTRRNAVMYKLLWTGVLATVLSVGLARGISADEVRGQRVQNGPPVGPIRKMPSVFLGTGAFDVDLYNDSSVPLIIRFTDQITACGKRVWDAVLPVGKLAQQKLCFSEPSLLGTTFQIIGVQDRPDIRAGASYVSCGSPVWGFYFRARSRGCDHAASNPSPPTPQPTVPNGECGTGYQKVVAPNGTIVCNSVASDTSCGAFTYKCGLNAASCCNINQNNPCWPGAYACGKVAFGSGKGSCCIAGNSAPRPLPPAPNTPPPTGPATGTVRVINHFNEDKIVQIHAGVSQDCGTNSPVYQGVLGAGQPYDVPYGFSINRTNVCVRYAVGHDDWSLWYARGCVQAGATCELMIR
jgi:hypothetical protein